MDSVARVGMVKLPPMPLIASGLGLTASAKGLSACGESLMGKRSREKLYLYSNKRPALYTVSKRKVVKPDVNESSMFTLST